MLRKIAVPASIFLLTLLLTPFFNPLEKRLYDNWLSNAHDYSYGSSPRHRGIFLLALEEDEREARNWDKDTCDRLADFLLSSKAVAVVFFPLRSTAELEATPRDGVYNVDESAGLQTERGDELRRVRLAGRDQGTFQPYLSLQLLARLRGVSEEAIRPVEGGIEVGKQFIPTDSGYRIPVRFRRSEELRTAGQASAAAGQGDAYVDVLAPRSLGSFWKERESLSRGGFLAGRVFFVGSGLKEASGRIRTPLGELDETKVQACVLETLLNGWHLWELNTWQQIVLDALLVTVWFVLLSRMSIQGMVVCWVVTQLLGYELIGRAFNWGLYVRYTPFLIATTLVTLACGYLQLRQAQAALKRFGGALALEASHTGDESLFEEMREKVATIVFTNVPKYLKELESYGSPDEFFEKRQAYAQLLADVFRAHKGVILDYQGDFQMIGFNVEYREDDPEHPLNAVRASQEFLARVPTLSKAWGVKLGKSHCGICTGPVACGHVGSQRQEGGRIAQAAIGDTSNVAARLLGAAMKLDRPVVMAQTTLEAGQGRIDCIELEPIPLKGKTEPVPICQPLGIKDAE